ncbi:hypothetical protein HZS_2573, partial [Henneguya salminicola]
MLPHRKHFKLILVMAEYFLVCLENIFRSSEDIQWKIMKLERSLKKRQNIFEEIGQTDKFLIFINENIYFNLIKFLNEQLPRFKITSEFAVSIYVLSIYKLNRKVILSADIFPYLSIIVRDLTLPDFQTRLYTIEYILDLILLYVDNRMFRQFMFNNNIMFKIFYTFTKGPSYITMLAMTLYDRINGTVEMNELQIIFDSMDAAITRGDSSLVSKRDTFDIIQNTLSPLKMDLSRAYFYLNNGQRIVKNILKFHMSLSYNVEEEKTLISALLNTVSPLYCKAYILKRNLWDSETISCYKIYLRDIIRIIDASSDHLYEFALAMYLSDNFFQQMFYQMICWFTHVLSYETQFYMSDLTQHTLVFAHVLKKWMLKANNSLMNIEEYQYFFNIGLILTHKLRIVFSGSELYTLTSYMFVDGL